MEFEKNTAPVSDDERRLAESKKITLQPVHDDVTPEAASDSEIAAHHLAQGAIANLDIDTEQSAQTIQPSKSLLGNETPQAPKRHAATVGFIVAAALCFLAIGIAAFFLFLR